MNQFQCISGGLALLLATGWNGGAVYAAPMGEGMMMGPGGGGMKEMMQRMMGDALPPGTDLDLLPEPRSQGAKLLNRYCTQCHGLPGPGMHTADEWPAVVERMNRRMQMMGGGGMMGMMAGIDAPPPAELSILARYLQTHAQRPLDRGQYSDLESPAGKAFQATCAQCHALPDPQQHSDDEWPGVVARMQRNMRAMGKTLPDASTFDQILGFLQRHARSQ